MQTAKIVKIGNSKGVRLGKSILDKYALTEDMLIEIVDDNQEYILLRPLRRKPREGWREAFKEMVNNGHDDIGIPDILDDDLNDI